MWGGHQKLVVAFFCGESRGSIFVITGDFFVKRGGAGYCSSLGANIPGIDFCGSGVVSRRLPPGGLRLFHSRAMVSRALPSKKRRPLTELLPKRFSSKKGARNPSLSGT